MDEISHLKKTLKQWEANFYRTNKRKPNREEIEEAPDDIKDAYAQYSKLRKQDQTRSILSDPKLAEVTSLSSDVNSSDVSGCSAGKDGNVCMGDTAEKRLLPDSSNHHGDKDVGSDAHLKSPNSGKDVSNDGKLTSPPPEVWGREFDKKLSKCQVEEKQTPSKKSNFYLQNLSSKLFANSKKIGYKETKHQAILSKQWKRSLQVSSASVSSQGGSDENLDCFLDEFIDTEEDVTSQKSKLSAESEEQQTSEKFGLFKKAASLSRQKKPQSIDKNSEDVAIYDKYATTPKARGNVPVFSKSSKCSGDFDDDIDYEDVGFDEIDGSMNTGGSEFVKNIKDGESKISGQKKTRQKEKKSASEEGNNIRAPTSSVGSEKYTISGEESELKVVTKATAVGQRMKKKPYQKWTGETVTPDCVAMETDGDNSADKFEFDDVDDVPVIQKQGRKRKTDGGTGGVQKKRKKAETKKSGDEDSTADNEDDRTHVPDTGGPTKPSTSAPRRKKVPQDNFVRLNMKVKTYKRKGGKGMTGPQHKRFMWKQKMAARSSSRGDNCFKCGQAGHWANKCPGASKSGQYGDRHEEPVDEEDFPSLQEAAMMAQGVKVNRSEVKKEKKVKNTEDGISQHTSEEEVDDEEVQIEAGIVRSAPDDTVAPPPMSPLIKTDDSGCQETPGYVTDGLKLFGFNQFRRGQERAVMRILSGHSTLVVLSTGGGKSLCYQLPAYLYAQRSRSVTLVISPLVSLMEDQITGLPAGVSGACLHTNMTPAQRDGVMAAVKDGRVHFLLVSPEAVAGGSMSFLNSSANLPPISFACIDEAHCLSEWSHNFRPSYLRLCKVLREKFGVTCFLGLTATATHTTAEDVAKHIGIVDLDEAVIRGPPVPRNLFLSVSRDDNRDQALIGLLQGKRFAECESIIIYCTRREQTDRLATLIRTCLKDEKSQDWNEGKGKKKGAKKNYAFWDAENYHAGLTAAQRKRVQNAFMSGRIRVVVATVAFGMGIDKSDVRGIIHYNLPKSFESYVQEIGRAGRDGKASNCHVFLDSEGKDLCELRRHTYANTVDYRTLKKFVQKVFIPCHCKAVHRLTQRTENNDRLSPPPGGDTGSTPGGSVHPRVCLGHERALPIEDTVMSLDVKEEGLCTLMCYLENHSAFWLQSMSNVYATCHIQCYGGPAQLQKVAKKCPPVAVAIAKGKKSGKAYSDTNSLSFSVVEVSDSMGWESGPVKRELKSLAWDFNRPGAPGPVKSGVMVEFSDLAFHFRSPGDLEDEEMDDVLQFLHDRVQQQEKSEVQQLQYLCSTLRSVSHKNYWMCSDDIDEKKDEKLKVIIMDYFQEQTLLREALENVDTESEVPQQALGQLVTDIRQFVNIYSQEHKFNGRAVARVFHGIGSPCFPPNVWGRNRRFWRAHMNIDFNLVVKTATKELISMR